MTQPRRYRLYIDESGDHTYNLLDEPEHRFLALLAYGLSRPRITWPLPITWRP